MGYINDVIRLGNNAALLSLSTPPSKTSRIAKKMRSKAIEVVSGGRAELLDGPTPERLETLLHNLKVIAAARAPPLASAPSLNEPFNLFLLLTEMPTIFHLYRVPDVAWQIKEALRVVKDSISSLIERRVLKIKEADSYQTLS